MSSKREKGIGERLLTYEPHYEGSPVIIGSPGKRSSAHGEHSYLARAGHHLPPQSLSSGKNIFEELGGGFTLIAFDAQEDAVFPFQTAARTLRIPLTVIRDNYDDSRRAYGAQLILVRPDQYVVWAGDNSPQDPCKLLQKVVGR